MFEPGKVQTSAVRSALAMRKSMSMSIITTGGGAFQRGVGRMVKREMFEWLVLRIELRSTTT